MTHLTHIPSHHLLNGKHLSPIDLFAVENNAK